MSPGTKILIIDDDPDLVEALKIILKTGSYKVVSAFDGEEGLKKAKEENPHLIILDLLLPKGDGDALCRELKGDSRYADIPILVLTAVAEKVDTKLFPEHKISSLPADDYVDKPVEPQDLLDRVKKLLARSKKGDKP
ncbi:response regulator [Candidatus Aerophobetes bacterium]|uniref:Response regulator n=1 Tax=Aerophobetes bacterium TaxID=2030807 RepID=A0A523UWL9_UNCAE|nr:MAG: response regulator [Candidatus Aerophobetes bacterium]